MTQGDPKQIYDFYGFPKELYNVVYPAKGSPAHAEKTLALLGGAAIPDVTWGIDHGSWSALKHLFPNADVPVFQMSIDRTQPAEYHYSLGKKLQSLRNEGILIIGSGNVVHSFRGSSFDMDGGHPWAYEFDDYIHRSVTDGNHEGVIRYDQAGPSARLAFETPDHYLPLLYSLGASEPEDSIRTFNRACVYGGFSMTGYLFSS
jgi:4,5-DOPA dioxygenase extradiol